MTVRESKFVGYGKEYVEFHIVEPGLLFAWENLSFPDFKQALANANAPAFDPAKAVGLEDEDGSGYDVAVEAAWEELQGAIFCAED